MKGYTSRTHSQQSTTSNNNQEMVKMPSPLQGHHGVQEIYYEPPPARRSKFKYPDPLPKTSSSNAIQVTPPISPQSPKAPPPPPQSPPLQCITTGHLDLHDGRKFHGNHLNGNLIFGVMTYPDGTRYEGAWVDGQREGQGCCEFPDGSRYEGEFHQGKFHGHGQLVWSDGGFYDGEFVHGQMHGEGMEVRGDGTLRHDGLWRNNLPLQVTAFDPTESERWRTGTSSSSHHRHQRHHNSSHHRRFRKCSPPRPH